MAKGLRMTEDALAAIAKKPGYSVNGVKLGRPPICKVSDEQVRENAIKTAQELRALQAAQGNIEAIYQLQLLEVSWPALCEPRFQWKPIEGRNFRLDVAFPFHLDVKVGIEVQGHVHRIKQQFLRDMERHNLLTEAGWTMYYVSGDMVRDGRAVALAKRLMRCYAV